MTLDEIIYLLMSDVIIKKSRGPSDMRLIKHKDTTDMTEVLRHQFCRVFTGEHGIDIPILEPHTTEKLAAVEVTPDMVLKRLMRLKVGKSCGHDEIHPHLLCELAKQQVAPLIKIYRVWASHETGRKQQCLRS